MPTTMSRYITGLPLLRILPLPPFKRNRRPPWAKADTGGTSATVNSRASSGLFPGIRAIYEPDTSVLKPVMPL